MKTFKVVFPHGAGIEIKADYFYMNKEIGIYDKFEKVYTKIMLTSLK